MKVDGHLAGGIAAGTGGCVKSSQNNKKQNIIK